MSTLLTEEYQAPVDVYVLVRVGPSARVGSSARLFTSLSFFLTRHDIM